MHLILHDGAYPRWYFVKDLEQWLASKDAKGGDIIISFTTRGPSGMFKIQRLEMKQSLEEHIFEPIEEGQGSGD